MVKFIRDGNCWTMGIGKCNVFLIGNIAIDLINPLHWIRIYCQGRGKKPKYNKNAWKNVFKTVYIDDIGWYKNHDLL